MLEELGLEYENLPVHFIGDSKKPDYLKLNPNGKVPTLDDDGLVIWESMAINLHLARKYGAGGLWPDSEADQAHTIQWSFWAMTAIEPPLMTILMNRNFLPEEQRDEAAAKRGEQEIRRPLGVLDGALEGRDYLLGARFTAADLNVCSVLSTLSMLGLMDFSGYPNLARWQAACSARPALAKVFPR
jgi:glutathione S-transferase